MYLELNIGPVVKAVVSVLSHHHHHHHPFPKAEASRSISSILWVTSLLLFQPPAQTVAAAVRGGRMMEWYSSQGRDGTGKTSSYYIYLPTWFGLVHLSITISCRRLLSLHQQITGRIVPSQGLDWFSSSSSSSSSAMCDRIVTRPVFIIPLLTWHVGHLLIDLLEPLYYIMMDRFGGR